MSGQAGVRLSSFQYLQDGVAHFNAGRFEEALGAFRSAIAAGESVPEARTFLGHVASTLGRPDEARDSFISVLGEFPRHLPAYDGLANHLLRLAPKRDPRAETALRRGLSLKPMPGLAETLGRCGQALRAAGDLDGAERALVRSLALGRDGAAKRKLLGVMRLRAEAFLAEGDTGKAEREYRRILDASPGDAKARKALVLLLRKRGLALVSKGRLKAAENSLRRAVALAPDDASARRQKEQVGKLREIDLRARRKAARLTEGRKRRALRRKGGALVAEGRLALAEKTFRRALAAKDSAAGRQLAEVLAMREKENEARLQAARVARGEKMRALLEEIKAASQAYRSEARVSKALASLARLLSLAPDDAKARLVAGGVLFSAGQEARGRSLLETALRLDGGTLSPGERFSALIKLGRYKPAIAEAEALLDATPSPADLRALQDPWEWDESPFARRRREVLALERALGRAAQPWASYYRADLRGPDELKWFAALEKFPRRRYGWMLAKAGLASLCAGLFDEAENRLKIALAWKASDWRTRGFLAEALACQGRSREAFAELERARRDAPADEKGQALAWRGALDLWLGRYASALRRFDAALELGAPYALAWRAASLLKLGRPGEALAGLDEALRLYPRDLEAYVWRAEAKRALGRHREALADLAEPALAGDGRATPVWLWALVNRALAKAALGDRAGLEADFDALPFEIRDYLRRKTGRREMVELLEAALSLARGYRREEFKQRIWMR